MTRVIVVEDDTDVGGMICEFLARAGLAVRACPSGECLRSALATEPAEIVVLDVNLPGENGFVLAEWLRASSKAGIIILTTRGGAEDRVRGLTSGADIYLTKPVHLEELRAAIANLARRLAEAGTPVSAVSTSGQWAFDRKAWALEAPNGTCVSLTAAEFKILSLLADEPGASVLREDILAALGKAALAPDSRSIDIVLSRLRKKVLDETGLPLPVRSVRATGYVFAAPVLDRKG